jgi:hypothetical protein
LGIDIADAIVVGGIQPYSNLVSGKLVAMLLCSSEVIEFYNKKYEDYVSVIASGMKGAPAVKKPNLCFLSTTSLYGSSLDQYTRVKIPSTVLGNSSGESIRYKKLGRSEGYGNFHFSDVTQELSYCLLERERGNVNNVFGEGTSSKLRRLRNGFACCGLSDANMLKHGVSRTVYAIPLVSNVLGVLLAGEPPKYKQGAGSINDLTELEHRELSSRISEYWIDRWVVNRIQKDHVIDKIEQEDLSYPINHGGRVVLNTSDKEDLFTDLAHSINDERVKRISDHFQKDDSQFSKG